MRNLKRIGALTVAALTAAMLVTGCGGGGEGAGNAPPAGPGTGGTTETGAPTTPQGGAPPLQPGT